MSKLEKALKLRPVLTLPGSKDTVASTSPRAPIALEPPAADETTDISTLFANIEYSEEDLENPFTAMNPTSKKAERSPETPSRMAEPDAKDEIPGSPAPALGTLTRHFLCDDYDAGKASCIWTVQTFDRRTAAAKFKEINGISPDHAEAHDLAGRTLQAMARDPLGGKRQLLVASDRQVTTFETLMHEMPNCASVVRPILTAARASAVTQTPLRLPPTIISGPPGGGKTRLVRRIAEILGTGLTRVSMPLASGSQPLTGTDKTWKSSRPGHVLQAILNGESASPVVLLDEIDKAYTQSRDDAPLDPLHDLWEPEGATRFVDDCVGVPADASHIFWFATANSVSDLRPSLLDRAEVLEIDLPTQEAMRTIIAGIYRELAASWSGWFSPDIKPEVVAELIAHHPRGVRRQLQAALTSAAARGSKEIGQADLKPEGLLRQQKTRIGFI